MAETCDDGRFLVESGGFGREPEKVSRQIPAMIKAAGGEVLVSRLWEDRRLAYPINGMRKGAYWLTYFRVDGSALPKMERKCQLSDSIVRVLFLKVDPRIVETLVAHALEGVHGKPAEEKPAAADKPAADGGKPDTETATP